MNSNAVRAAFDAVHSVSFRFCLKDELIKNYRCQSQCQEIITMLHISILEKLLYYSVETILPIFLLLQSIVM